jgi:hypothetical protein
MSEPLSGQLLPVLLHAGDPEPFWEPERCPPRARARGWFYGGGDYPLKEDLHAEVMHVLERHSRLKMVLAHFHFLYRMALILDERAGGQAVPNHARQALEVLTRGK